MRIVKDLNLHQKYESPYEKAEKIQRLRKLSQLLDSKWNFPGTKFKFGLDGLLGFMPVIGDSIPLAISSYIIYEAYKLDLPSWCIAKMIWNVFIDWLIGLIPFFGDIFDIGFKSNLKNLEMIEKHAKI